MEDKPVAPASSKASAWTNPRPLPAPDTKTTLPPRLNSGSRFAVPKFTCAGLTPAPEDLVGCWGGVDEARRGRATAKPRCDIGAKSGRAAREAARGRQRRVDDMAIKSEAF